MYQIALDEGQARGSQLLQIKLEKSITDGQTYFSMIAYPTELSGLTSAVNYCIESYDRHEEALQIIGN